MKSKLQEILDKFLGVDNSDSSENEETDIKLATSVLFLELALADFKITKEEQKHLKESIQDFFDLPEDDVLELIDIAKEKRNQRQDIWLFTNKIKEKFNRNKKIEIVELLWGLVYADGTVDKYEEALMRKISGLLGLSHGEMIQAKLKSRSNNG